MIASIQAKVGTWASTLEKVQGWQAAGESIVFTNGCFDLLHYGHLHLLASARNEGDRLVVGLNATPSIKRLKGPERPVQDDQSRLFLLAGLSPVDAVVVFEEDTPFELIKYLQPDVLVKGGDWAVEQIVGAKLVQAKGGRVLSLPFIEGFSSTNIINKIKSL